MPVVVLMQPWDPVAAAAVNVRVTNVDDPRVTTLDGLRWWPVLARSAARSLDLFDGDFSGRISASIGDLEIGLAAHPDAPRYSWGERPVTIWRGDAGAPWASWVQVFKGLTRPVRASRGRMQIPLRADDRWYDKPLLPVYAGTGGLEGPAELKGVPKPLAIGRPQFVPPVLINRVLDIYQLSAFAIQAVPALLDRLSRFSGPAYAGDHADYAALAAASITRGQWRSCLAQGLVRFGAPPVLPSAIVEGDSGSALGWVRRPGAVIRRLAILAGADDATQIDAVSLAALDTWAATLPGGGNISRYFAQQATVGAVIQEIAASCNAAAGIGHDGKLFVARVGIGSPSVTLAANGTRTPAVASTELLEASSPFWRLALEAEITERVHGAGEFGLIDADQVAFPDGTPVGAAGRVPAIATVVIKADHTGAALAGQLPRAVQARRFLGDTDVTTTTTWSIVATGCTATIGAATGLIDITACTTNGKIVVTSVRDTVTIAVEVAVLLELAPPPSSGGGGSGGGGSASGTVSYATSSTSYGTAAIELTVTIGTGGTCALAFPGTFTVASGGTQDARGKWQRETSPGTWADVGSEASSTEGADGDGTPGSISVDANATGLTPSSSQKFRLLLRRAAAGGSMSFTGTASAVAG
ncbi:hypothetical protein [Sandarakinorhabdus sp.]|uniref:hypothetical protein n=1 Tax=Sandarakinorhabdus sp. TaxID=1916663 RepID=UPI00286D996A|nr:hypothetical protein [Sandarakinorhabdus sp.]